jgi:hypothetical protein
VFKRIALVATGFVAGAAVTLLSVGYGAPIASADDMDVAHMAAVKAQVMHTIYLLDVSGFHALDEGTHAGTIPAGALGSVRRARIMAQATEWPETLKPTADSMIVQLQALETALRNEDAAAAAGPAGQVHDIGHDLSGKAYDWLSGGQSPAPQHVTDGG